MNNQYNSFKDFEDSIVYCFSFDTNDLKKLIYNVYQKWMFTIAYFRWKLINNENNKMIKKLYQNFIVQYNKNLKNKNSIWI